MRNRTNLTLLPLLLATAAALCTGTTAHAKLKAVPGPAPAASQAQPVPKPVDVNSASRDELMAIPGIGESEAARIIKGRPWRSKALLVVKKVIPEATYHTIKRQIVAIQKEQPTPRQRP